MAVTNASKFADLAAAYYGKALPDKRPTVHSNTPLVNIDKAKQAFAASTLCQHTFFKPGTEVNPQMLCAVSAMVVYAGMTPELWGTLVINQSTLWQFARPILQRQYNIPEELSNCIPTIFDNQPNEWRAVEAVLKLFEDYNKEILHCQAIDEDQKRFPQLGPNPYWTTATGILGEMKSAKFWTSYDLAAFDSLVLGKEIKLPPKPQLSFVEEESLRMAMSAKARRFEKIAKLKELYKAKRTDFAIAASTLP